jgi:hypothetical protein
MKTKRLSFLVVLSALSLLLMGASPEDASLESLPKASKVFAIACHPQPKAITPYFTSDSLLKALPGFRRGEAEIKVGDKRIWQSGVIVLTDKSVMFWSTCRTNFIYIATPEGTISFIRGDGKDDL